MPIPKTLLLIACIAVLANTQAHAQSSVLSDTNVMTPRLAPPIAGHVYINSSTGERVFSDSRPHAQELGNRGSWEGWSNTYPDPCDPNTDQDQQLMWFTPLASEQAGDNPDRPPLAVAAWNEWIEHPGDISFCCFALGYTTYVPDPDSEGGGVRDHHLLLTFTENDRATHRSGALAHSPIGVAELPGDINQGQGTSWVLYVDLDPDDVELGDTDNSTHNPQAVDIDGDGLYDSGFYFTFTQPGVDEGDLLGGRFPELGNLFDEFTTPLDTATFPNILDVGPLIAHPSGYAGIGGEPNCYASPSDSTEWLNNPNCRNEYRTPLGTWDLYGLIDATGADSGTHSFGGFRCIDNGPGMPFNNPWASPYFEFGSFPIVECPRDITCGADLNADWTHDLEDVVEFIRMFLQQNRCVDYAEPIGFFDLADVVAFAHAFQEDCP